MSIDSERSPQADTASTGAGQQLTVASFDPDVETAGPASAPQIVFPPDTRTRVADTTQSPYVSMGQLIMDFPNGARYTGTGTLIDGSHVLTAAHNLFGNDIGGWARNVWYVPARDGGVTPYGTLPAQQIFIPEEYRSLSPADPNATGGVVEDYTQYVYDFGVVRLQNPLQLPILGMYAASDRELRTPARITGYPGDKKPHNTMWTDLGQINPGGEEFLFYKINTFQGESGAAVLADLDLPVGRSIVGVHVAGDKRLRSNFGVRLTGDHIRLIQRWMRA